MKLALTPSKEFSASPDWLMLPDDRERLLDILTYGQQAVEIARALTRDDLEVGYKNSYALAYAIQTVGEASSKLTSEFRKGHVSVDWDRIIGMRHRIVHGYGRLDLDIIWRVSQEDIPALLRDVGEILYGEEGDLP